MSLGSLGSQLAVRAGQQHLHKVRVVQSTILVGIKELNNVVAICFSDAFGETVIPEEVKEGFGAEEARSTPVDSHECLVRLEVLIRCQVLPLDLYLLLVLRQSQKQVRQQTLSVL